MEIKGVDLRIHEYSNHKEVGRLGFVSSYDVLRNQNMVVQLETLSFEADFVNRWHFYSINEFPFLKQLTVYVEYREGLADEYYRLVPLINACPLLHRLSLKATGHAPSDVLEERFMVSDGGQLRASITVLEMTGFGMWSSNHFLAYARRNFVMLEKLVIDNSKSDYYLAQLPSSLQTGKFSSPLLLKSWCSEE